MSPHPKLPNKQAAIEHIRGILALDYWWFHTRPRTIYHVVLTLIDPTFIVRNVPAVWQRGGPTMLHPIIPALLAAPSASRSGQERPW
jgi:hypothetical protein